MNDSDGDLADNLVLNDSKKRARSVSQEFEPYKFFERETIPDSMKCRFKTKKPLTAVKETDHTITMAEGRIIHIKLASNP